MRYLVTGGLGVIGSCIARRLLAAGHDVAIIDSCEEPRNDWIHLNALRSTGVTAVWKERIERSDNLSALVQEAEAVIHCAASTGIPYSVTAPDDDWERNVEGTRALLEALRKNPRPTVVLSSVKPYRVTRADLERPSGRPSGAPYLGLTEETPLEPDEPYAASKAAQSMLCMAYARSYGLPVVTFRCSNLYGPAPCHGPRHGWLTWFCVSAAIGRPIEVQGTGEQSRDMLHADDVFSACMLALEHAAELRGGVFNLGGGRENLISVARAAEALRVDAGAVVVKGPPRAMDDDCVFVDFGKFARATGWHPRVKVEEGVRSVLAWAQAHAEDLRVLYANV